MIDGIDPPRCTATLQEDGKYTIRFTGVSGAMGMFGGDLEFTIKGDGFTYSDSYTVEVDYTTYKSSIVDLAFEDVELRAAEIIRSRTSSRSILHRLRIRLPVV